jgi:molybdenum cofactor biosynthesis protein B
MSVEEHRREAPDSVRCMVITVSDTRTEETDKSGRLIKELLQENAYIIENYRIVKDDYHAIRELLLEAAGNTRIETVLLNGGTGIAHRDTTYEAVKSMLDKELPGFGEIFRYLSYVEDIGSAAILSRAIAGTMKQTAVFSMPGSSGAVRLAMKKLILPELRHVMRELYKDA